MKVITVIVTHPLIADGQATLTNPKKVDEDLYKREEIAPVVDIAEDKREEGFRLDINSWTLNKSGPEAYVSMCRYFGLSQQ